ncbi:MAG: ABC transporter permease [Deltaproteobacteria bacterium]|nr:ABC transporter permease [Deltaproteobacteria bacterium]MCZ6624345.1 ABC transporter permease [Deltaproteobacteria bacterium]
MKNIFIIAGKDIRSLFASPIAYVVLTGFLLLGGWFFFNLLFRFNYLLTLYTSFQSFQGIQSLNLNEQVIAPLLHNLTIILVIMVPIITMRTFAEEKRNGTYELLLTSPLTVTQIVIGKFLGSLFFILVMILLTGVYPAILLFYGNPELGILASGYLGLFLLGVVFVSVGILTSSLTENQIVAAVSCFVILLLLYVLSWPAETTGAALGEILKYLSVIEHFSEMVKGIIDTKNLIYFFTVICLSLFLTHRSVEASRWR